MLYQPGLQRVREWGAKDREGGRISFSNKPTPVITISLEMATLFSTHELWELGRGGETHSSHSKHHVGLSPGRLTPAS